MLYMSGLARCSGQMDMVRIDYTMSKFVRHVKQPSKLSSFNILATKKKSYLADQLLYRMFTKCFN